MMRGKKNRGGGDCGEKGSLVRGMLSVNASCCAVTPEPTASELSGLSTFTCPLACA